MIIYLNSEHFKQRNKVYELVDHELLYNPNFNGVEYEIKQDDFTWIDGDDYVRDAILIGKILNLLNGEDQ